MQNQEEEVKVGEQNTDPNANESKPVYTAEQLLKIENEEDAAIDDEDLMQKKRALG